jgi:Enoyl-CoA hydratase/isomerase
MTLFRAVRAFRASSRPGPRPLSGRLAGLDELARRGRGRSNRSDRVPGDLARQLRPDGDQHALPRGRPVKKAALIQLTGENLSGEQADRLGLVSMAVDKAQLEEVTIRMAQQMASRHPAALATAKIARRSVATCRCTRRCISIGCWVAASAWPSTRWAGQRLPRVAARRNQPGLPPARDLSGVTGQRMQLGLERVEVEARAGRLAPRSRWDTARARVDHQPIRHRLRHRHVRCGQARSRRPPPWRTRSSRCARRGRSGTCKILLSWLPTMQRTWGRQIIREAVLEHDVPSADDLVAIRENLQRSPQTVHAAMDVRDHPDLHACALVLDQADLRCA